MKYTDRYSREYVKGDPIHYKVYNGTSYHEETPDRLVLLLESLKESRTRIVVDYGDTKTGRSWGDTHEIEGYIGRSTGESKIPLLVFNSRSIGGGALLDHCILTVKTSKGKQLLYSING